MVMPKLLLTMMLLMQPILLIIILDLQTPKYPHINLETAIIPPMLLLAMFPPPTMLSPPTLSQIPNLNVKLTPGQLLNLKNKNKVTNVDTVDDNASHNATKKRPPLTQRYHCPRHGKKTYMRQLRDGQEYHVAKGNIIKNEFSCEAAVER